MNNTIRMTLVAAFVGIFMATSVMAEDAASARDEGGRGLKGKAQKANQRDGGEFGNGNADNEQKNVKKTMKTQRKKLQAARHEIAILKADLVDPATCTTCPEGYDFMDKEKKIWCRKLVPAGEGTACEKDAAAAVVVRTPFKKLKPEDRSADGVKKNAGKGDYCRNLVMVTNQGAPCERKATDGTESEAPAQ